MLEPEWESDYADILDCALWHQKVEVEDACAANSGDSWNGFVSRHGTHGFDYNWETEREKAVEAENAQKALAHQRAIADRRRRIEEKLEADRTWWEATHGAKPTPIGRRLTPERQQEAERFVHYYETRALPRTNVEPWFDPKRMPTAEDLRQIELYAVNYFASALGVSSPGAGVPLTWATYRFKCARDADAIAGALYPLATSILSAGRSRDLLGLRVLPLSDGAEVVIDIECHP